MYIYICIYVSRLSFRWERCFLPTMAVSFALESRYVQTGFTIFFAPGRQTFSLPVFPFLATTDGPRREAEGRGQREDEREYEWNDKIVYYVLYMYMYIMY